MTDTGTGELIKRLRDGINPDDGAFDAEPPSWARDPFNEDMADKCGRCGSWRQVVRPGKTQCTYCWDDDTRAMRLEAADALEAAERVIRFYAHSGAWGKAWTGNEMVGATARDWLARHATGQKGGEDEV